MADRFLIGPMNSGLETDLKPFVIADDAYARLDNAYIFRGRIRKRFGSRYLNSQQGQLNSRLRVQVGTLAAPISPVPGNKFNIGQMFSVGPDTFTVWQNGAMLSSNPLANGTFNTATGAFTIVDPSQPGITPIYWYPSEPVMGIVRYEVVDSLTDPTIAFDTQFSYQYAGGAWVNLPSVPPAGLWTGSNSQFFWTTTWIGITPDIRLLFVVNNNAADQIQYWNNVAWTRLLPQIDATPNFLFTAKIVVVFKGRLVFLNTSEGPNLAGARQFTNRARWSVYGDPTGVNAFRQDIPGQGNFIDAATLEDIVSAQFIKDRLIVFFEKSTWEFAYTGNQVQPFTWQKLNTELGAEATFSSVPFDKVILTIGNVGIHACNGVNVERIDNKIPDTVFDIHTGTSAVERVAGIRDYFVEQVYWTFPNVNADINSSTFPNKVLVYNYKTGSWAFNDDSITAFGYFYADDSSAISWDSLISWDTDTTWSSGISQPQAQLVIAGNQEGYTFIVDAQETSNAFALQLTNLTLDMDDDVICTVINHNMNTGDFVKLQDLNGLIFVELPLPPFEIVEIIDANSFIILSPLIAAALEAGQIYAGGGTVARASRIDILTKQFNPYMKQGRNVYLSKVDFLIDRTEQGEIAVDFLVGTANDSISLTQAGIDNGVLLGNGVLTTAPYPISPFNTYEQQQDQLWHPVYFQADGLTVQLRIYLNDDQMQDNDIVDSPFQLHMMILNTQRTSYRPQ